MTRTGKREKGGVGWPGGTLFLYRGREAKRRRSSLAHGHRLAVAAD